MPRPTGRLLLLAVLLCLVEPLGVAQSVAGDLGELAADPAYAAFLVGRVLVASVSVAAGLALWQGRDHAFRFTKVALAVTALAALIRFTWFPGNVPPGLRLAYALVLVGYNAAWYAYVVVRERQRATSNEQ